MYSSDVSSHPVVGSLMASYDFDGANGTFENDIAGSPFGGYYTEMQAEFLTVFLMPF